MLTPEQLAELRREPTSVCNRLRRAMELTTTTQVQLSQATGITQPYVSAIVNGKTTRLPLATAQSLAAFFGCSIEDLFPRRQEVA
jgi:transcriptional regulator with XRE-family HTH domain